MTFIVNIEVNLKSNLNICCSFEFSIVLEKGKTENRLLELNLLELIHQDFVK